MIRATTSFFRVVEGIQWGEQLHIYGDNSPLVSATHTPPTLQALEALVESCPEDEVRDLGLLWVVCKLEWHQVRIIPIPLVLYFQSRKSPCNNPRSAVCRWVSHININCQRIKSCQVLKRNQVFVDTFV